MRRRMRRFFCRRAFASGEVAGTSRVRALSRLARARAETSPKWARERIVAPSQGRGAVARVAVVAAGGGGN